MLWTINSPLWKFRTYPKIFKYKIQNCAFNSYYFFFFFKKFMSQIRNDIAWYLFVSCFRSNSVLLPFNDWKEAKRWSPRSASSFFMFLFVYVLLFLMVWKMCLYYNCWTNSLCKNTLHEVQWKNRVCSGKLHNMDTFPRTQPYHNVGAYCVCLNHHHSFLYL